MASLIMILMSPGKLASYVFPFERERERTFAAAKARGLYFGSVAVIVALRLYCVCLITGQDSGFEKPERIAYIILAFGIGVAQILTSGKQAQRASERNYPFFRFSGRRNRIIFILIGMGFMLLSVLALLER